MFTTSPEADPEMTRRFADSLFAMSFDNPKHRPILELEGLERWVPPQLEGYASLKQACAAQAIGRN